MTSSLSLFFLGGGRGARDGGRGGGQKDEGKGRMLTCPRIALWTELLWHLAVFSLATE